MLYCRDSRIGRINYAVRGLDSVSASYRQLIVVPPIKRFLAAVGGFLWGRHGICIIFCRNKNIRCFAMGKFVFFLRKSFFFVLEWRRDESDRRNGFSDYVNNFNLVANFLLHFFGVMKLRVFFTVSEVS